jgi:hypothetical protein
MCMFVYIHLNMYKCIHVCMYACMYVCIYICSSGLKCSKPMQMYTWYAFCVVHFLAKKETLLWL